MKLINRIMANEEAFHLVLAAFIGIIGGLVNLVFLFLVNSIQWIVFRQSDSPAVLPQDLDPFLRIITPNWVVCWPDWFFCLGHIFLGARRLRMCWRQSPLEMVALACEQR